MIVRAAVVPHPPLLVPELVAGTDGGRDRRPGGVPVRRDPPDQRRNTLGGGRHRPDRGMLGPDAAGTFAGFGVDVVVRMSDAATGKPDPAMPLPALIAAWLREQAGADEVTMHVIPPDLPPEDCYALGERLAEDPVRSVS